MISLHILAILYLNLNKKKVFLTFFLPYQSFSEASGINLNNDTHQSSELPIPPSTYTQKIYRIGFMPTFDDILKHTQLCW